MIHTKNLSNKNQNSIRFGLVCNGTTLPAWVAGGLHKLLALDAVKPALLIIKDDFLTSSNNCKNLSKLRNFRKLFWNIYKFYFVDRNSKAMHPVDVSSTLAQVPFMRCKAVTKKDRSQHFSKTDIDKIRDYDLDFILDFGFNNVRGEILNVARFGIWSFHHGDIEKYKGYPAGFWEIYKGDNITGAILQRLTDQKDSFITIKKGFFRTIKTSYARNRDMIYFESADWPAKVCIDIKNGSTKYLNASPSKTSAPIFHVPNNIQMIFFLIKIVRNFFLKLVDLLFFYQQFNIGIVDDPIHVFLTPDARPMVRWLPKPEQNKFIADPFAICQKNAVHILFEDYDYHTSKGSISTMNIDGKSFSASKVVINNHFHMSYPYLLEHNGKIYCIPETCQSREVSLYAAKEFPNRWKKVSTLIKDFAGLDNTIFRHEDRWWLLTTDYNKDWFNNLNVWYAPDLFGPWKPHAANPVKLDVRSARPAGTPFVHNGHLYRPAQDCSESYGGKTVINRVIRLTPTEFEEEQVAVIKPYKNSPYPDGIHTISAAGNMTIIDGAKKVFVGKSLSMLKYEIKKIKLLISSLIHRK